MTTLKEATISDEVLSDLKVVVQNGWPDKSSDLPKHLQCFWSMRDYIGIEDGILTKLGKVNKSSSQRQCTKTYYIKVSEKHNYLRDNVYTGLGSMET